MTTPVRKHQWKHHAVAGLVCLAILGAMGVTHAWPLWFGQVVRLEVRPIDPRDPFRGEYVWLSTPAELVPGTPGGQLMYRIVYVQLRPVETQDGTVHRAVGFGPAPIDGEINLRGRSSYSGASNTIRVDYGLNAFYMKEGTALPVEQAIRSGGRVLMEVAIAESGRARIRNLIVNGTPLPR